MASREQYVVPSATGQTAGYTAPKTYESGGEGAQMSYLCADCGIKNTLRRTDPIRCKECGGRVLYKQRTKRMVQFEAR